MNIHKVVSNFGDVNLPQKNNLYKKNMHETCHPKLSMHISKRRATSLIKASPLIQDLFRNKEPKMITLKLVLPT
jgi:hypothetical protein